MLAQRLYKRLSDKRKAAMRWIAGYRRKQAELDLLRRPRPTSKCADSSVPLISVIIPIYDTEKYIEKCVRSVMEQTFSRVEIICIDDASPDRSAALVKSLAQEDSRIRLIRHNRNLGLGGARNSGIAAANAAFVTGVDSDDYILPEMLQRLWDASDAGMADVVACGMALVKDDDSLIYNVSRPRQTYFNDINQVDIINLINPSFCNKLWRTAMFTNHGIRFPEAQYFEDLATTPRVLRYARDIRVIPDPLYCYVVREGSITHSTSPRHIIDHFKVYDLLTDFLASEGLLERYRSELIEMIGKTLNYHTRFVIESDMSAEKCQQYMRYMLMLKLAYLEHNDKLRTLEPSVLQDLLLRATSSVDIENISGPVGLQ